MDYLHKCVRCGYCCLSVICPIASHLYGSIPQCPMLTFNDDKASCGLAGLFVSVGDGCCIKARAFHGDEVYDFASLPGQTKRDLAQKLLNERGRNEMGKHIAG